MAQKAAGEVRVVAARPRLASCSRQKLSATSGLHRPSPYLTLPYLTLPSEGANLTANGCTLTSLIIYIQAQAVVCLFMPPPTTRPTPSQRRDGRRAA